MSNAALGPVLRHIRKLAASTSVTERTDQQLLQDFATRRDEAAFATLVSRHGGLVLSVCHHVLRHAQDAEDAFQATFLVLARKAASIRKREALVSWLHGVAYRMALKAKRSAARRRQREKEVEKEVLTMSPKDPSWEVAWQEVQTFLAEEVERLPAKYRAPFLLCCLEGYSQSEAARRLGLKEGTVWSRLSQARKRLQERLARRGVALGALLSFAALGEGRCLAAVPARLASTTVRAALHYAGLRTAATVAASAQVVALADGLLRGLVLAKLKSASVVLMALGVLAAGASAAAQRLVPGQSAPKGQAQELGPAARAAAAAVPPAPAADAVMVKGQVLGPDGQPCTGANISLWTSAVPKNADPPVRTTTGADGRFLLPVTALERAQGAAVVAQAPGHGPDWVEVHHLVKDAEAMFRLTKDDVPITGRIIDPEGRPIPGVTVEVRGLGHQADCGDLAAWINRKVKEESQGRYSPEEGLQTVGVEALNLRTTVTTGADGRFQLTGFGREKVVTLDMHGMAIEHARLRALTKPGPGQGWIPGRGGLYAAAFDFMAGPPKPIVGTVRDKATSQPLAGITVACS
jgi:RNA polymerase sigma factor (sigma-70 family)